ncbi:MAG: acyl-CoA desaturase [Bacteroidetes bacterium]|nr:MAG: acyl-CoA desaturase [Bacteroidota bacterium]REK00417.1 MAG: acyl-CoA desaturase [Bacteroidota bacterium]REK05346.1 MAG: acyl-CoA desaturase [Bacteroidota bacterium]REK35560.1 MAG: acyl-CoA desaturase [Bacteroidota bacterium]REK51725.1 MAG: acyl-CoA desaturase [Bacteroidota bacterium]
MNIKFKGNNSDFYTDLKSRVNAYFESKQISTTGDRRNVYKSAVLLGTFFFTYILLAFHILPGAWNLLLCMVLGFATALIGFNIMHDGAHGSLSKNPVINRLAALTLNMLGASSFLWNIKHNVIHHTFTNVDHVDDDILNEPFFRMTPSQKRRKFHKYQHLYFPFAYGLMYMFWVFVLDIKKYLTRRIAGKSNIQIRLKDHIGFWLTKIFYAFFYIVLPLWYYTVPAFILGFLVFAITTGLVISVVFQLAHTVEETEFIQPPQKDETTYLESDWATHQIKTTANFATRNKIVTWMTGGLNFQVEHHLFPKISHVHYPALAPIVKQVCTEHGLPYHEQRTLGKAIASHVRFLYNLGRN